MQRREIPRPRRTRCQPFIEQTKGKIGGPGTGGVIAIQAIEPEQGFLQNSLRASLNLLTAQIDITQMKSHQTTYMIQRHPVKRSFLVGQSFKSRVTSCQAKHITMC